MKRLTLTIALAALVTLTIPLPAFGIIHEIVSSHCAGHEVPNNDAHVDPPGQLNTNGNSFGRALQATGVYTFAEGEDQGGEIGLNVLTGVFGPLPGPGDENAVTVYTDNTRPSAKLGDNWIWVYFFDDEVFGEPLHIYLQLYDLDHPAFEHCKHLLEP